MNDAAINYAAEINAEFERLRASTDVNPYSGLTAENGEDGVKVFDDYASGTIGFGDAPRAIAKLKELQPIDWTDDNTEAFDPIWQALNSAGLY
jgi:hypothetical protein